MNRFVGFFRKRGTPRWKALVSAPTKGECWRRLGLATEGQFGDSVVLERPQTPESALRERASDPPQRRGKSVAVRR